MRVFVTGASGWIGSAVVPELLAAGHAVVGLARSDDAADRVSAAGADVLRGGLEDLRVLRDGAEKADAVVHLAFHHDFTDMAGAGRKERAAIETFGDALQGSGRPFLFASGLAMLAQGRPAEEGDATRAVGPESPRGGAEHLALSFADRGIAPVALRFAPSVHGAGDHGFVARLVQVARETGIAGYVGAGSNRWAAVHRDDAARLVRLALEQAPAASVVHAVGEEGVATRDIAETIGRGLDLPVRSIAPEDAATHFGWIGGFFAFDMAASSAATQQLLGWTPTQPGLLEDITAHYLSAATA